MLNRPRLSCLFIPLPCSTTDYAINQRNTKHLLRINALNGFLILAIMDSKKLQPIDPLSVGIMDNVFWLCICEDSC